MRDPEALFGAAQAWLDGDPDPNTREALKQLLSEARQSQAGQEELARHFAGDLAFGTAGLRGVVGPGPSSMNLAVVVRTTAALARVLESTVPDAKARGVCVGFDARPDSRKFAEGAASVLAGHGFKVHLFFEVIPTPLLAFSVLDRGAAGGAMITASHNPPEYNGYKVYWENGAQIIPPVDEQIRGVIDALGPASALPRLSRNQAPHLFRDLGDETVSRYSGAVRRACPTPPASPSLRIAYTALHGVGNKFVQRVLRESGFTRVASVASQSEPDGSFPTVRFPNPEEAGAMDAVLQLGRETDSDLAIANDPDADRLAVAVPDQSGNWQALSGNDVGALLADFLLAHHASEPAVTSANTKRALVINTIVSSPMLKAIAAHHGAAYAQTLTGFKWISNLAEQSAPEFDFVFGFEEALGYCVGNIVRDKDGISAALAIASMAAWAKQNGRNLLLELERLWRRDGLFLSRQVSIRLSGSNAKAESAQTMDRLRRQPASQLGPFTLLHRADLLAPADEFGATGSDPADSNLPSADVLRFELSGGQRVMVRPSGTEPKIKFYFDVRVPADPERPILVSKQWAAEQLDQLQTAFFEYFGVVG